MLLGQIVLHLMILGDSGKETLYIAEIEPDT